ncbi:Os07g0458900 [Oryza sativa Japonica Group]|uniref:Os07g0458900 protein n=1 Tax=Oryza sativa subsp. japonica TaxID=39947 RepID=C7J4H7_ORYSJ|nr:Os07g0458900 [Oryza sativa Japonica Group]|eukprot:NP_001175185.1 Os07g0458900 [Oryza sativa Japonica Group]
MDRDGFDNLSAWASQPSASGPTTASSVGAGFDLNSQAPAAEGFPGLGMYGAFLQGDDDELLTGRGRGSSLPPYRPPRAGVGDGRATPNLTRQLNFGNSSSAGAGRGGGNGGAFPGGLSSGRGVWQHSSSAATALGRRSQHSNTAVRAGGSGQRLPRPRAPRSAVRGQASSSDAPFNNEDEELEDDVEEFASSGGPPRRVGTYNGAQMSGEGYQAIVDGLLDRRGYRRGLVYTRCQVKNQILVLKTTHSFWRYLQAHTGLGRLPDGTIDAESLFWKTHTERLQWGPPENEELLDQLFRGYTVDGSTTLVPGDDYGQDQGQEEEEEDEEFQPTPSSTSSQRSKSQKGKRPLSSTTSTLSSPMKKSKSPMVKIVKDIASTFKEAVIVNTKQMQKRASDKAAFSVKRCQELAFECGVEQTIESVYAMSKMFETEYQREFFCGQLTPELRLGYFKKWCRDNNLDVDNFLHVLKQEEDHGPMVEEAKDDGGSTSEDEIISMCRNNLVHAENSIVQLVPILGMYSDNYFVKLPKRVNGDFALSSKHL